MTVSGTQFLDEAEKFLGDPYVYGAKGPSSFDCSGLVQYVATQLGLHGVPRTSEAQYAWVKKVSSPQVGDLVFSQWPGDNTSPGHVGIYAGGNRVLEASETGTPVRYVPLDANYKAHVVGYGRVPGSAGGGSGGGGGGLLGGVMNLALPDSVKAAFDSGEQLLSAMMWLIQPESWARIIAGIAAAILAAFGVRFLLAAA